MKDKGFVKGATLLTTSIFIAKILGAIYRIPLTNILGAEGMGIYQLIFPIFSLLLTLSSGGIPASVSILVSQKKAMKEDTKGVFFSCLIFMGIVGFVMALFLIFLAVPISDLEANTNAAFGYIIIAPSIFFVSMIAVIRGYYMGQKDMFPNSLSQIIESVVKMTSGLLFAKYFLRYGLQYSVMGALLGITLSEFVTFIILFVLIKNKKSIFVHLNYKEYKNNIKEIYVIAIPLTLGGIILPLSQFVDSILIVNILRNMLGTKLATINYGLFSGSVSQLINLPIMVSLSLSLAVIPIISENKAKRNLLSIKEKSNLCVKLSLVVGIPFALGYALLSERLLNFLYPILSNEEIFISGSLLRIAAINVIFLSINQIYTSILQALGETKKPVIVLAICIILKTVLNVILLPLIGINGAAVSSVICFCLAAIINVINFNKLVGNDKALIKNGSLITLCGVIMSLSIFGISYFLEGRFAIFVILIIALIVYLLALIVIRVFSETELANLPLSKLWLKIDRIFRRNNNVTN